MDIYEEMLLQIVEVLKKHNKPLPDLTHKEAIEEIRSIVTGNTTHAEKVTPDDIKKLDNTDSFNFRTCGNCYHLIFKDYKHCEGFCEKLRISRRFNYPCIHEEDMK